MNPEHTLQWHCRPLRPGGIPSLITGSGLSLPPLPPPLAETASPFLGAWDSQTSKYLFGRVPGRKARAWAHR